MKRRWLVPLVICACSSDVTSAANTAHLNGTVNDKTLTPRSAVALRTSASLSVLVSDQTNTCAITHTLSATSLTLVVPGAQVAAGTFAVPSAATASFTTTDQTCKTTDTESAQSGTITLNEITNDLTPGSMASRARGSFTLTFTGGHMVGDFDALLCGAGDAGAPKATCSQ